MVRQGGHFVWYGPVVCVVLLAACSSSGPVPMGKDTYMLSNTGAYSWSSGATLKGELFREADSFCRSQGKHLMPLNTSSKDACFQNSHIQKCNSAVWWKVTLS